MKTRKNVGVIVFVIMCLTAAVFAADEEKTDKVNDKDEQVIKQWKIIVQDKDYNGAWVVSGDLTGDGKAELVYTRTLMDGGDHYTASALACTLDIALQTCLSSGSKCSEG